VLILTIGRTRQFMKDKIFKITQFVVLQLVTISPLCVEYIHNL
jgi:hypothetical protein